MKDDVSDNSAAVRKLEGAVRKRSMDLERRPKRWSEEQLSNPVRVGRNGRVESEEVDGRLVVISGRQCSGLKAPFRLHLLSQAAAGDSSHTISA